MRNEELDMVAYHGARADEQVWRAAKGEAALVKPTPPSEFIYSTEFGFNAEMLWENMAGRGYLVPNDLFFVRQSSETPRIAAENWKLTVDGPGVTRPFELTYDQLLALPAVRSVVRGIECAGNGRVFYREIFGQDTYADDEDGGKVELPQWRLGAVGVAEWTGVQLGEVLERAGVKPSARDVVPHGLDESQMRRPMSMAKAMEDDTLLVYAMNGEPLPADHGFPVRVLTPGWIGNHSIKWVGRIEVAEEAVYTPWNTQYYVMVGPDYRPAPPSLGPIVDVQVMKSALELAWPARLTPTPHTIGGRSWGPRGVARVEYSVDDGRTWAPARLSEPSEPTAWVQWSFDWEPAPGEYRIRARAIDPQGNAQPDAVPFNQQGYNYGAVVAHPVTVTSTPS
ncbi:MAG: sulfite oxidase [Acidimicrobiia bacterium]